ncbi:hypothetical protein HYX58_00995 [Candidatus Dependentiae bacterium]|nr:hypothetical protein [Candidatus Dependentiae bacterium]
MNLTSFMRTIDQAQIYQDHAILALKAPEYPLLFSSALLKKIKQQSALECVMLDLEQREDASLKAELSVGFLGQRVLYWLGDLSRLENKRHKVLLQFLSSYRGPHLIVFYSDLFESSSNQQLIIELKEKITREELSSLAVCLMGSTDTKHLDALLTQHETYAVEAGCLLIQYASIMSRPMVHDFQTKWLTQIIAGESSLFTLSGHFFSGNQKSFFSQWQLLRETYPDIFWIAFWSEQLFRAASFIELMRANEQVQAKKIAFRLPFMFIKGAWQNYNVAQLQQAHDFLYRVDCSFKQGGQPFSLELFYLKFFLNEFK